MSFRKITFKYTPPQTVPLRGALSETAKDVPDLEVKPLRPDAKNSRANKLIQKLIALHATSAYLQRVILARTKGLGVELDEELDFEVILALNRLYNVDPEGEQLKAITVEMYNSLLDSEMAIMRADIRSDAKGPGPTVVSPVQRMDIYKVNKAFEDAMIEAGEYKYQLPTLLRDLKGDQVIFESVADGLRQYPIIDSSDLYKDTEEPSTAETIEEQPNPIEYEAQTEDLQAPDVELEQLDIDERLNPDNIAEVQEEPADGIDIPESLEATDDLLQDPDLDDISPGLTADMEERLDLFDSYYGALYNLAANIDKIYMQIGQIVAHFFYQPLHDILSVIAMLKSLKTLFHVPKLKSIRGALAMFIFPRLLSGLARFNFMVDRLLNKMTFPVNRVLGSLGNVFAAVRTIGNQAAWLVDGGLTGTISKAVAGEGNKVQVPDAKQLAALNVVPDAIKTVTANLYWAVEATRAKHMQLQASFIRALERRMGDSGDRLEVIKSLRSVDAIIGVLSGLQRSIAVYSDRVNQVLPNSMIGIVSGAVQDFKTEAGTVFSTEGELLVAHVPDIPRPTGQVQAILTRGGAELQESGQFLINLS